MSTYGRYPLYCILSSAILTPIIFLHKAFRCSFLFRVPVLRFPRYQNNPVESTIGLPQWTSEILVDFKNPRFSRVSVSSRESILEKTGAVEASHIFVQYLFIFYIDFAN